MSLKKFRKTTLVFLVAILSTMLASFVYADELETDYEYEIILDSEGNVISEDISGTPRFTMIHMLAVGMTMKEDEAAIFVESETYDKVDHNVKAEVYESKDGKKWYIDETFTVSESNTNDCILSDTYYTTRGYYYKLKGSTTVKSGSQSESTSKTTSIKEGYDLNAEEALEE